LPFVNFGVQGFIFIGGMTGGGQFFVAARQLSTVRCRERLPGISEPDNRAVKKSFS
jgi:hypothetical protein